MSLSSAFAIYFVVWWLGLFAVLPFGVRSQTEAGEVVHGSDPGAPAAPRLVSKLAWTTCVSALVFAVFYASYQYRLITVDDLTRLIGMPD